MLTFCQYFGSNINGSSILTNLSLLRHRTLQSPRPMSSSLLFRWGLCSCNQVAIRPRLKIVSPPSALGSSFHFCDYASIDLHFQHVLAITHLASPALISCLPRADHMMRPNALFCSHILIRFYPAVSLTWAEVAAKLPVVRKAENMGMVLSKVDDAFR